MAASEQLVFDILARDAASASFLKVGQAASAASGSVGDLNKRLTEINGRIATARVQLSGNKEAQAALDKLQVSLTAIGARTAKPNVQLTDTGFARAVADISAADVALDKLNSRWAPAKTGLTSLIIPAQNAFGWFRVFRSEVSLFGGALGTLPIVGTVTGLHLITEAIVETTAVVLPAAVAFTAFGVAAVPTVQAIYQQMKNLNTVATALNVTMPGLSGGFSKAAAAVQPQVYQLFGDALVLANQKGSAFVTLAHSAGTVLDQLAARFTAAVTSGNGFGVFVRNATTDLSRLGDIVGNVFGVFGNLLKVMPGYAQVLLTVADDVSKLAESFSRVAAPVLQFGLAAHGAVLYAGLLGTAVTFLATRGLNLIANVALAAAGGLENFGTAGKAASGAMLNFGAAAEGAAALPWGWIGIAVAGFVALVVALNSSKDAAQTFNATIQQTLANTQLASLSTTLQEAQIETAAKLTSTTRDLAVAQAQYGNAASRNQLVNAQQTASYLPLIYEQGQYGAGLAQLQQQGQLVNSRVSELSKAYGGNAAALGVLNAAGITSAQILDTNKSHWAATLIQIDATSRAYKEMGQQGGILGSDLNVINALASTQYTDMNQLNSAWDTYLGNIGKLEGSSSGAITAMRQLTTDSKATGASFTGVNAASLTLQNDFNQNLFPAVQQVIDGLRSAGAPTKTLAQYMSTLLTPAVKEGALANLGMRTAIYDMAQEAGYTGPNKVGPLTRFLQQNVTTLQQAANNTNSYAAALGRLPRQVGTVITETIAGKGNIAINASGAYIQGESGHITVGTAAGGFIRGGRPGHDSVPIMAMPGEVVVPTHMVRTGAVDHLRGRLPGFAAGGIVSPAATTGQTDRAVAGIVGNFQKSATNAFISAFELALNSSATGGGPLPSGASSASPGVVTVARYMLAHGATRAAAAGIGGVIAGESGGNPEILQSGGGGAGLLQWTPAGSAFPIQPIITGNVDRDMGVQLVDALAYIGSRGGMAAINLAGVSGGPLSAAYRFSAMEAPLVPGSDVRPGVVASLYAQGLDQGGFLPPGLSLAWNGTGRPEPVIPGALGARSQVTGGASGGATLDDVASLLEDLIGVTAAAPGGFAGALNGMARSSGYGAMYNTRP